MDQVVHFHIPVNEMDRAKKFYTDIFGWEIEEIEKHKNYQLVTTVATDENDIPIEPGAINGALYVRETPEEYPEITIEVSSIDDYLKKIEEAGGKLVTPKTPVGDFGFYAEVLDTENNTIGLWEDKE
jgi:predicted enzyme related to lactoylglutathione lyase